MNVEIKISDAELLRTYLSKSGDALAREEAFRRIVDRYAGLVFAVSFRIVNGDRQLAEDCVQATFIILARRASSVRKPGMLSAWLHGTARRIATTHVDREAKRRRREQQSMELQEQNQRDADNRTTEFVLDNLGLLSTKLQSVLILHYLEGYSYAETADILGCSVDAVGKRIERAVAKLRRHHSRSGKVWGKIGTASLVVPALSPAIKETCAALGSSAGLKTAAVSAAATQLAAGVIVVMKTKTISVIAAGLVLTALMSTAIVIHAGDRTAPASPATPITKTTPNTKLVFVSLGGTKYTVPKLRELYLNNTVFAGKLVKSTPGSFIVSDMPGGAPPQTDLLYEDFDEIKGKSSRYPNKNRQFALLNRDLGDMAKQTIGKSYVTFFSDAPVSFEAAKDLLAIVRSWKAQGVMPQDGFLAKARTATWIVKARCTNETCMESYPCQHYWEMTVDSKIKGKNIPGKISVFGSYRSHKNTPAALKDLAGVRIYLLKKTVPGQGRKKDLIKDTDVLGTAPWSEELEAKLRKPAASK